MHDSLTCHHWGLGIRGSEKPNIEHLTPKFDNRK